MGPKPFSPCTEALFINRLDELLNLKHPLMRLAGLIDWVRLSAPSLCSSPLVEAGPHCHRAWSQAGCSCSTTSMRPTKPSSTPRSRTRTAVFLRRGLPAKRLTQL